MQFGIFPSFIKYCH